MSRPTKKQLISDACNRIRNISDSNWHISAVLYLGIKPEVAAQVRKMAERMKP